jgi:hypothetical protein
MSVVELFRIEGGKAGDLIGKPLIQKSFEEN